MPGLLPVMALLMFSTNREEEHRQEKRENENCERQKDGFLAEKRRKWSNFQNLV